MLKSLMHTNARIFLIISSLTCYPLRASSPPGQSHLPAAKVNSHIPTIFAQQHDNTICIMEFEDRKSGDSRNGVCNVLALRSALSCTSSSHDHPTLEPSNTAR